ncbi:MAG: hypothetical protein Q8O55_07665 [Dehalococcoidales bacterium]|nr:hypothetical protein [Dehalococcoidales bacterium]
MDGNTKAQLFQQGGQIISDLARALIARPPAPRKEPEPPESPIHRPAAELGAKTSNISMPTSEETTEELKRRLAKELYRMELDLAAGLKIAGKPCDCGSNKHTLMLEAAAEELISQDPGNASVYQSIINWIPANRSKIIPEAIQTGKYASEYPRMANEFKMFRKGVLGSIAEPVEQPGEMMTLEMAKKLASEEAAKEVERAWRLEE